MSVRLEDKKENQIFNHYKSRIEKEAGINGKIRFNVVEYLCSFPHIDPYHMAQSLRLEGYEIAFDDSSISKLNNLIKRKKVYG